MLRSIFVALLSLNILFAAWQFLIRPMLMPETSAAGEQMAGSAASPDIDTTADTNTDIEPELAIAGIETTAEAETARAYTETADANADAEIEAAQTAETEEADVEPDVNPVAEADQGRESGAKGFITRIQSYLASDAGEADSKEESGLPADAPDALAVNAASNSCYHFGPIKGKRSLRFVRARLAKAQIAASLIVERTPVSSDYWVFIEPQKSRRQATRLLSKLQSRGIDSYIISDGDKINGISLGFYTLENYAKETQAKRIKQGYEAKLEKVERFKERYTLQLSAHDHDDAEESVWTDLAKMQRGATLQELACQQIADKAGLE